MVGFKKRIQKNKMNSLLSEGVFFQEILQGP
jgi:hypothetical protein